MPRPPSHTSPDSKYTQQLILSRKVTKHVQPEEAEGEMFVFSIDVSSVHLSF
jgi:hypothetical protein